MLEVSYFNRKHVHSDFPVHSIYFGGGTPSLLQPSQVNKVLRSIRQVFAVTTDCEITLEANPGTVFLDSVSGYREAGVNRLSLGVQSTHQKELTLLERQHSYADVLNAVQDARKTGIDNINLDLIYGLPYQELKDWEETLRSIVLLNPDHLSLYSLTIEEGTPFMAYVSSGKIVSPDSDLAADMYEFSRAFLSEHGFLHYEISNWAKSDKNGSPLVSRHNCQYWRNEPYLGFGAGAHGYFEGVRLENESNLIRYIEVFKQLGKRNFPSTPATKTFHLIDREREMRETLMMGLRLIEEGVSTIQFKGRFGLPIEEVFGNQIDMLVGKGLLEWVGEDERVLRLTKLGHLLGNQVFIEFV